MKIGLTSKSNAISMGAYFISNKELKEDGINLLN